MKKRTIASLLICFALLLQTPAFSADSTGTPSGSAVQPDIDLQGAKIINAGDVDTDKVTASESISAPTIAGNDISAGRVNSSEAVIENGDINTVDSNRTYVRRYPTHEVDGTNKQYVDDRDQLYFDTLSAEIEALRAKIEALE